MKQTCMYRYIQKKDYTSSFLSHDISYSSEENK